MNTDQHLDQIIHSGTDALVLGVIDQVGKITYREALAIHEARQKMAEATAEVVNAILKF